VRSCCFASRRPARLSLALASSVVFVLTARPFVPPALAGPNAGGVLVVHEAGLEFSADIAVYPTLAPESCGAIDVDAPTGLPEEGHGRVWKIYAVFPEGSHPRLKAIAFGATWTAGDCRVLAGGPPDRWWDFELPTDDWLTSPGGGTAISLARTATTRIAEVYWIAGYATAVTAWALTPHPYQAPIFVDDSVPPREDAIEAFGVLGFGQAGTAPCPAALGACCAEDATCRITDEATCLAEGGTRWSRGSGCDPNPCDASWGACCLSRGKCVLMEGSLCHEHGGLFGIALVCDPNPCPPPPGACCRRDGYCDMQVESRCADLGGLWAGPDVECSPNPCPYPTGMGACCLNGQCLILDLHSCAEIVGAYLGDDSICRPNPCPTPPPLGACCFEDGSCQMRVEEDCIVQGGISLGLDRDCWPNPCLQPVGACCLADGTCLAIGAVECGLTAGAWLGAGIPCKPNPCAELSGACCLADGSCRVLPMTDCPGILLPCLACEPEPCVKELGGCCFHDGSCLLLPEDDCRGNGGFIWWEGEDCMPNPCDTWLPVETTSWGQIKLRFGTAR